MKRLAIVTALLIPFAATGCNADPSDGEDSSSEGPSRQTAVELVQVSEPGGMTGGALLEGPVFDEEGRLFLVDVLALPDEP
ncbi:hypothetical protein O1R50_22930 [Glycomyces luteolus]|jgi:lactonase|uniref:Phytase-like domain-containing protein n=2 Tax=Glycomyces TaxID=58113 RepID=A0A9X3PP83_9ACTN|nr:MULTISPECIES: hypothetical protein [Glycomyces]MDA1362495.1 hypothetical protein [Glycomyces luteolus]MDN3239168.1 hypothetical protein [Glycomyces tritici]